MLLFAAFLFAYVLSQFFRAFLAVIAPTLASELSLTPADLANMSAAWFAVFALAQFPLGVALDRVGPKRTVPLVMLAGVAGAVLLGNAGGPASCILALALIGLGCSPIYMGALYYYGRTESPARFGFISSCMLAFGSAGNLLAATPLALATQHFGWRSTIVVIGFTMLVAAGLFWALVRDPPPAQKPAAAGRRSVTSELVQVVTLPGFWTLMPMMTLGYAAVVVERGLWVGPYFAEVHRLEPVALGNAVLGMALAMSVGALCFGSLERAIGRGKLLVIGGSVVCALGFILLGLFSRPPTWVAIATMALIGFMGLCQPLLFAHARQFFPDHLLGRGITFANFLTIGGAGVVQFASGAFVAGLFAQHQPAPDVYAALHLMLGLMMLAATAVYVLSPAIPSRTKS